MGIYRSTPETHPQFSEKSNIQFQYFMASVCGWQLHMEDKYFSFEYSPSISVLGLLDGHFGPQVPEFCAKQIKEILSKCQLMKLKQYQAAIENLASSLDGMLPSSHKKLNQIRAEHKLFGINGNEVTHSGASMVIVIIGEESITIGQVGPCCKSYIIYQQSEDKAVLVGGNLHTVQTDPDWAVTSKTKSKVIEGRINGAINYTRSIGDLTYKSQGLLSNVPAVFSFRKQDIKRIILGTSGLWERGAENVLNSLMRSEAKYEKQDYFKVVKSRGCDLIQGYVASEAQLLQSSKDTQNGDEEQETFLGLQNITIALVNFND